MRKIEKIHFYVEKIDKVEKFLLLDFISKEEFLYFKYRGNVNGREKMDLQELTMLLFRNVNFERISFREEEIIIIEVKDMAQWTVTYVGEEENNNVIAFEIMADNNINLLFQSVVSKRANDNLSGLLSEWKCNPCALKEGWETAEIKIFNVGQGSWNRISYDCYDTVFDCGCSIFYSRNKCREIIKDKGGLPRDKMTTSLIISHWDVDHYNLLCAISDSDIKKFCCIFIPDRIISLTAQNVSKRLKENCTWLNIISPCDGKSNELKILFENDNCILWIGNNCASNNKSGLALGVFGKHDMFLFPADHTYTQLWDGMYNTVNKARKNLVTHLTVPHHGGNAGIKKNPHEIKAGKAVVSTGKNNYGHPRDDVRKVLCRDTGFEWIRTDWEEDDISLSI